MCCTLAVLAFEPSVMGSTLNVVAQTLQKSPPPPAPGKGEGRGAEGTCTHLVILPLNWSPSVEMKRTGGFLIKMFYGPI